jgi:hypothetical protein
MSHLTAVKIRCVAAALRLAAACAADRYRQDVLLSAGARQPTVSWRTADVINQKFPHWHSQRLVRDGPRRSMPAPRATNATSVFSAARTAARFAFGWGLVGFVHTATSR